MLRRRHRVLRSPITFPTPVKEMKEREETTPMEETTEHVYPKDPKRKIRRICILVCSLATIIIIIVIIVLILTLRRSNTKSSVVTGFTALPPGDITFNPEDPSSYEEYVALLNRTIASYEAEVTENMIDCSKRYPKSGQVCLFRDTWLNQCRKASLWGYKHGRPCVILTFSNDSDFMPEISGGQKKLPELMPEDLMEELESNNATVGVHCTDADDYSPLQVFGNYFFLNKNVTGYLPPLVAVTFDLEGKDVLEIQCTLWNSASSESISATHSFRIKRSS